MSNHHKHTRILKSFAELECMLDPKRDAAIIKANKHMRKMEAQRMPKVTVNIVADYIGMTSAGRTILETHFMPRDPLGDYITRRVRLTGEQLLRDYMPISRRGYVPVRVVDAIQLGVV